MIGYAESSGPGGWLSTDLVGRDDLAHPTGMRSEKCASVLGGYGARLLAAANRQPGFDDLLPFLLRARGKRRARMVVCHALVGEQQMAVLQ